MLRRYFILVVGAIILLFVPIAVISPLRNATIRAVRPVGEFLTTHNLSVRNAWLNLTSINRTRDERNQLQQQVIALQQQVITSEDLKQENSDLRKELGVTGITQGLPKVFARVVLQGDNPLDYTFTVDVGKDQGVRVGQPAISQGILVGRVIDVRGQSAVVRATTSLQSRIQARLVPSQEKGFLVGTGNGIEIQDITQGLDIPTGTVVETSGLGGSLPQGILIGASDALLSAKSDLTQTFRVTQAIDPLRVQSLFILLTEQP